MDRGLFCRNFPLGGKGKREGFDVAGVSGKIFNLEEGGVI